MAGIWELKSKYLKVAKTEKHSYSYMQLSLCSPGHIYTQKYTGAQEERAEKQNIGLLTRKKEYSLSYDC